ncbi:unnamed protein product [Cochlearia groenlandica]
MRTDLPERLGQQECKYYLKSGNCYLKQNCKYNHHKENIKPREPSCPLNDKGLPLRHYQIICPHYCRFGICRSGPICRFDHFPY